MNNSRAFKDEICLKTSGYAELRVPGETGGFVISSEHSVGNRPIGAAFGCLLQGAWLQRWVTAFEPPGQELGPRDTRCHPGVSPAPVPGCSELRQPEQRPGAAPVLRRKRSPCVCHGPGPV